VQVIEANFRSFRFQTSDAWAPKVVLICCFSQSLKALAL